MQIKVGWGWAAIAVIVLAGAASSYFSPYWTIYQMKQAYDRRDAAAFSAYIDFPSLRVSVKAQLQAGLRDKLEQRLHGHFLAGLGAALASNVADPAIDALVSPEAVAQEMRDAPPAPTSAPATANPVPASPVDSQASAPDATAAQVDRKAHYLIRYRDWSTVTARTWGGTAPVHARHNPLWSPANTFVLRRTGLWSWQLAAIEFPPGALQ